jgi:hypothetical protein
MHISSNTAPALRQVAEGETRKKKTHRSFSAAAGSKEEDGVVAGLGDGAGYEVLQLTAQYNAMGTVTDEFDAVWRSRADSVHL